MLLRLRNAVASMTQMMRQQERTANNLANAGTTGFRRDRIFAEALNERLDAERAPRSDRFTTQAADLTQGAVETTGNPLDVALGGDGFFELADAATGAMRYTRAGRFVRADDGTLQTPQGHTVQGEGGPITIPPETGTVDISRDGVVRADGQRLGRLRVVDFAAPEALERLDGASFAAAGQPPVAAEQPRLMQGHLEGSNVDPVREMTEMIQHFRQFESQQKMLRTADEVLGKVTRDLGKF